MAKLHGGPATDRVYSIQMDPPPPLRSERDRLQFCEQLRLESADIVRQVFRRRGLKRFGTLKYAVSRARNGCLTNPVYRLCTWLIALRVLNVPFSVARLMLDFLNDLARLLWAPLSRDSAQLARETQGSLFRFLPLLSAFVAGEEDPRPLLDAARSVRGIVDELVLALEGEDLTPGVRAAA